MHDAGVRVLAGGGEAGLSIPLTRRKLAEAWGTEQIYDAYGVGEALFIGQSCSEGAGGVHVIEDVCHSYTVDQAGEPRAGSEKVGENVITSYTHLAQPFIKYRTHDLVRLDPHPHGCGWTWGYYPGSVLGRADFMVTIRGVNVYPSAVEDLIGELPGLSNHYELHITGKNGMDRMLVKVEAGRADLDYHALAAGLADHFRSHLGVRLEAEVLEPEALPRYELKTKRVFDHRETGERPQITFEVNP